MNDLVSRALSDALRFGRSAGSLARAIAGLSPLSQSVQDGESPDKIRLLATDEVYDCIE